MIRITFLGTAAARPTVGRNVSGIALQREGESMLFDCGEGTQRQMMRFGTGFSLKRIFFTHLHADHFLGLIGLLRTMGLQGRTDPLDLYGPPGAAGVLKDATYLGVERTPFPVLIHELRPGEGVEHEEYRIETVQVRHGTNAVGYALREFPRRGRFDVERARALGVPDGPMFGRLHRGETIEVDGRSIDPAELVGPSRPGRLVVYTGDTRPADTVVQAAAGADLLIHEATFTEEDVERAHETYHSTARDAARVATDAGAQRLVLTHISARYSENPTVLEQEAREIFPDTTVAHDGLSIELEYGQAEETGG